MQAPPSQPHPKQDPEVTVVNFLWGDWPGKGKLGRDLAPLYLKRFRESLKKLAGQPFRHLLYTDRPERFRNAYLDAQEDFEIKELGSCGQWGGCLPKFRALAADPDLNGQILVMDLDNVFLRDLSPMFDYRGDFAICNDVDPSRTNKVGGNIASFPAGRWDSLWQTLKENPGKYRELSQGSERFLFDHFKETGQLPVCDYWNELHPGLVLSFKREARGRPIPPEAAVLWTHGQPRPHKLWRKGGLSYYLKWKGLT
ncbi:MAG: hypothetical protein Q7Q71_05535 [Verrucomicrobiota bacterium JB023]|nr:hypothetical protein [Verrucomicrobiota bacterium JB023]